jgi:hypothetical protein
VVQRSPSGGRCHLEPLLWYKVSFWGPCHLERFCSSRSLMGTLSLRATFVESMSLAGSVFFFNFVR